jgi:hypothetical protein
MLFFPDQLRGLGLMLATLVGSTAVAYMVCLFQDRLIEPLRSRVRSDALAALSPGQVPLSHATAAPAEAYALTQRI